MMKHIDNSLIKIKDGLNAFFGESSAKKHAFKNVILVFDFACLIKPVTILAQACVLPAYQLRRDD